MFGDGREERMAAFDLEMKLRRDPEVSCRRALYNEAVRRAGCEADALGRDRVINALIDHNPAYIRDLLDGQDWQSVRDRFARTFYKQFKQE